MTEGFDPAKVARRSEARRAALAAAQLAIAEAADLTPDAAEAFWQQFRATIDAVNPVPPTVVHATIPPMSDAECIAFERQPLPFGRDKGRPFGEVAERDRRYITWLAQQTFTDNLRRYLRNPTVRRQLGLDESPEDDDEEEPSVS